VRRCGDIGIFHLAPAAYLHFESGSVNYSPNRLRRRAKAGEAACKKGPKR
jgi:hypothetical protein